jgi:hypothetical protein
VHPTAGLNAVGREKYLKVVMNSRYNDLVVGGGLGCNCWQPYGKENRF